MNYMKVAFHLANLAKGRTSPNPPVGAVLVKSGEIIGKGLAEELGGDDIKKLMAGGTEIGDLRDELGE